MIAAQELSKTFGTFCAVDAVSFAVRPGSICALLGPNGAGKSTLVRMLTGLLAPSSGTAQIAGKPIGDAALRKLIGVLPESLALFDALTIRENLRLTADIYQIERSLAQRRMEELLRFLRLQHGRDSFIHQCSYGMKKKTALAMALLPAPRVLFLDEPFEGIDPVTSESLRLQLRALAARGLTILLTSHILSLVDRVADQILMIRSGKIVLDSATQDLPRRLEDLYFELVEDAEPESLEWFG